MKKMQLWLIPFAPLVIEKYIQIQMGDSKIISFVSNLYVVEDSILVDESVSYRKILAKETRAQPRARFSKVTYYYINGDGF